MMNKDDLIKFMNDIGVGVMLVFDEREAYYFKYGLLKKPEEETKDCIGMHVRQGTYQDGVYLFEGKLRSMSDLQFMFYPYKDGRLQFAQWQKEYEPVYVCNDGVKDLEVDTPYGMYLIPAGKYVRCHKDEYTYRIDAPIAERIDRHNINTVYVKDGKKAGYGQGDNEGKIIEIKGENDGTN